MTDKQPTQVDRKALWKKIAIRALFLTAALVVLYFLLPSIVEFFSEAPKLASVDWWWFALMAVLMSGAFMAAWELSHVAVPDISRFVAACSQLVSNAMAKVIPGGAVAAGTKVDEQHYLNLELETFLSLCGEEKSQARIQHMLMNGKPLRN